MMSLEWWKRNVIYHIYIPSFKDSNNDGIGDFQGLISKLDYFKELRVYNLLLSPFYPSPMKDNGYDITCFTDIDPMFGTMNDFNTFMNEVQERKLNVIIDFVANHTSDQHPWFIKSINQEEPFSDFYIWVDAKSESADARPIPPNNWLSVFGGSAWTWNEKRKQFYFHQFLPEQPDLNYHNPRVRSEMKEVLSFWLEKGVDGFRIDAASHLFEDERLLDEPLAKQTKAKKNEYGYLNHIYTKGQPETFQLLKEWRALLDNFSKRDEKPKILLIEGMEEVEDVIHYYGPPHEKIAEIPMNFQFYKVTHSSTGIDVQEIVDEWLKKMPKGKFPNYVMSSHDFPRVATRVGSTLASSLQMIMMLLPGIPICYYGDELGMENCVICPEEMRDSFALRTKPSNSRDPMRTPMQWDSSKNAGFSDCDKPWLPVHANYINQNVEVKRANPFSSLENFKKLVKLRREPSILFGTFDYAFVDSNIFSFTRSIVGAKSFLIVVNMSDGETLINLNARIQSLPVAAYLVLTNPKYSTRLFTQADELFDYTQSSTSAENTLSRNTTGRPVMVPLNNLYLQPKQGMVLSYDT
ncbi:maltase 1 [Nephila pilipes]|uniref:alpha-glucosidase n=1 Tax=Nephila pilipes TaxID=299642 RepID=A0A8X6P7Z6_NEPPI|nr:maltase 1 [Nephila pilipes]